MKKSTLYITQAAVIAALYVALTYASNALGLAYNAVQFRLSEILTVLPVFTPAAIPGLTIGCILANLASPFGIMDIACGSLATLLAALVSYGLKQYCVKGLPVFSTLPPVLFNTILVGLEIWWLEGRTPGTLLITALEVMAGELVMCVIVGIPFLKAVQKTKIFDKMQKYIS